MTNISILGGEWEILFNDETVGGNAVAGMKMVRHISGTAVVTTRTLYSAIAEVTDDFIAMGFENPMLPVTPNAYTMENNYFIPRSSTEFLDEGAIDADWTLTGAEGVLRKEYAETAGFVSADIGRQVVESASGPDTGTLLDFEVEPDGTTVVWIRPDSATDVFDGVSGTISMVADGGTGVGNVTVAAISGQTLFSSIQAIGSVPTATEVYLYQGRNKMTDSTGAFQWWVTDSTVSLGIIDILIRVINADVTIFAGDVEVFARRYTSLYDNFRLNVVAGGRSALPLASAPDINNTTGYFNALYDTGTGSPFAVGDLITNTTGGKIGGRYVVTAENDGGATGDFDYYTSGDLTEFASLDTFTSPTRNGAINGAPTPNLLGPTDPAAGEGGTVTIVLGTTTFDHDGDGTAEPYSVTIDSLSNVIAAKVYERIKYVTRRGGDTTDLFGAGTNIPGESYRGLEVQVPYNTPTGVFTEGDDITGDVGNYSAVVMAVNTGDTYVTITDQQTSVDSVSPTDTLSDEAADTIIAEATIVSITSPKSSPFGTFTGTVIFGATGILFANPDPTDTQNYILTDDNGVLRSPPNTQSYVVENTAALDRVFVARDTGVTGIIDKDQFGGLEAPSGAFNGLADLVIRVAGVLDSEVPQSGTVRIVDDGLQEEHMYVYDTIDLVNEEFDLRVVDTGDGIADGGTSDTALVDASAAFDTVPVALPGMLIVNTGNDSTDIYEIVSVTNDTTLVIVKLYGAGDTFTTADTYTLNALIGDHTVPADYSTADNIYDTIIDEEATTDSVSNTFVKTPAANFGTVCNVRQGKIILPFTQNQEVNDGGASVTTVRTPDTIAV
jgi:hypothetical protein